jgi:hypothetical protein
MTTATATTEKIQQIRQETTGKLRCEVLKAYPFIPQEDYVLLGYFLFFMGRLALR